MIPSAVSRNDYAGNGSVATYPFVFQIVSPTELLFLETTGGTTVTKLLNTDYTVSQNQDITTGGTVTRVAGNLPVGTNLAIIRNAEANQPSSFSNNGIFYPSAYEAAIDYVVKAVQYYSNLSAVTVLAPQGEIPGTCTLTLPPQASRAGMLLGFDQNGNIITTPGSNPFIFYTNFAFASLPNPGQIAFAICTDGPFAVYNTVLGSWQKVNMVGP